MRTGKTTNREVKRENRNRVFRYVCRKKVTSNPEIAYSLKLSLPTVTQNTRELIEMGLIEDQGEFESTGGRKAKVLSVTANAQLSIGLDITQNHVDMVLVNLKGEKLDYRRLELPFQNSEDYFCQIRSKVEEMMKDFDIDRKKLLGIGISLPGIVNMRKKQITESHTLGIKNTPFEDIEKYFGDTCFFINDANAGAYAEKTCSSEIQNFVYLSLSNTVGGAVYTGNELSYGMDYRCGEVGHMTIVPDGKRCYCGKAGCLDAYCSAKTLSGLTNGNLKEFFKQLEEEKAEIQESWKSYTKYLAIAVNNLHMILDCDILIGGYVGRYMGDHIEEIRNMVAMQNPFGENGDFVKTCQYGGEVAAMGAALHLIETYIDQI